MEILLHCTLGFRSTRTYWMEILNQSPVQDISGLITHPIGSSSLNAMIPKKTSLMSALNKVFGTINSKINAMSFRTPTSIVSIADGTFLLKENVVKK